MTRFHRAVGDTAGVGDTVGDKVENKVGDKARSIAVTRSHKAVGATAGDTVEDKARSMS